MSHHGPRKFRWGCVPMTRDEAQAFIALHKAGKPVRALDLQEAVRVLARGKRAVRMSLPQLTPYARERVNAVLLFNLGRYIGRAPERKAA